MWNFQVPVLMFDSKTRRIVMVNTVAAALFEATEEELQSQTIDCCLPSEERDRLAVCLNNLEPQWGAVGAWQCLSRTGNRFIAQIRFHQTMYQDTLVHVVLATEVIPVTNSRAAAASSSESLPAW
jgi:nitrogen-specific signal transduction histidine kinase